MAEGLRQNLSSSRLGVGRMMRTLLGVCTVLLCAKIGFAAKPVIDTMRHDIGQVTQATWNGKVAKFRDSTVFVVLFYQPQDKACRDLIDGPYNELAKKMKGIVGVLAVDCSENAKLCKEHNAMTFPHIAIFPTLPIPAYTYEGPKEYEAMAKAVRPLIPSNVKNVANAKELEVFLNTTPQMPKVLLFSDKLKKPSILVKALSNAFKDKLNFVLLNSDIFPEAVKKFRVSSFPHLVVVRKDKKDEVYKGEFEFQKLFDWLNIFSETFVMGGGFSDGGAPAGDFNPELQPWWGVLGGFPRVIRKLEAVPELTRQSSQDLCFKKSIKHVCVILVKNGRELTEEQKEMMESLKDDYEGHSGKGPDFRFMWMDLAIETEWASLLEVANLPSIVAINPHKKVRYIKLDSDLPPTKPHIRKLLSKISSGDARFKIVPQAKVPKFVERKDGVKTDGVKKDEL